MENNKSSGTDPKTIVFSCSKYLFFTQIRHNDSMEKPLLLAPMAELSHRGLRELIESYKGQNLPRYEIEYFTEMISAGAFINGGPFESWYADNGPCPEKLVYQLVGGNADQIARAAGMLNLYECLGIDINMGCSAPAITRTGAGVRWMEDIDRAGALIRRIRPLVSRRLSVKLRTGLTDDFDYLVRFCRRLQEEGVELITLHPRTAKEKFKRRARWSQVSALRKELRIPVAGNGDINSADEIESRSGECDAVMIGRLAVRKPWIFYQNGDKEAPDPDLEEAGLRFFGLLAKYQPAEFHISRARRFFHYFCDNLKWGNYVKNLLNRETSLLDMEKTWRRFFAEQIIRP